MHISRREMERRAVVAKLMGRITDVIGEFVSDGPDGITYAEILAALNEQQGRAIRYLLQEDWGTDR